MKTFVIGLLLVSASLVKAQLNPAFTPFSPISFCGENDVFFVCISPQNPDLVRWTFGDGETAQGVSVSHKYRITGTYTVKMYIEKDGTQDSITKEDFITVRPRPEAKFTMELPSVPLTYKRSFSDMSVSNADSMVSYMWDIGTGPQAGGKSYTVTFPDSGWYTVRLTVTNNVGCMDDYAQDIYIAASFTGGVDVGMKEVGSVADALSIYPNPAKDITYIAVKDPSMRYASVKVINLCGVIVYESPVADVTDKKINVEDLKPGIYLVEVKTDDRMLLKKFYKTH